MREMKPGGCGSVTEVGEVFKYIVSSKRQYTLIALYSPYNICTGCVFYESGGHPLSIESCTGNGLECSERIFKPIDDVLESL